MHTGSVCLFQIRNPGSSFLDRGPLRKKMDSEVPVGNVGWICVAVAVKDFFVVSTQLGEAYLVSYGGRFSWCPNPEES